MTADVRQFLAVTHLRRWTKTERPMTWSARSPDPGVFAFRGFLNTVERRLSGHRLSGLSNYPDQSDVLLCFFFGIFRIFSCKNLFPQIL